MRGGMLILDGERLTADHTVAIQHLPIEEDRDSWNCDAKRFPHGWRHISKKRGSSLFDPSVLS
jgi:hypothetical protein